MSIFPTLSTYIEGRNLSELEFLCYIQAFVILVLVILSRLTTSACDHMSYK
jgi:hypothetical protein